MLPAHKESVRHHPGKFLIGVALHVGVLLALALLLLLAVRPTLALAALPWARPLLLLALAAGLILAARRALSPTLRFMSTPDDYLAIAASCGLLALTALAPAHPRLPAVALIYGGALLLYLPLGKLRHAVFFFAARLDYGRRLGYRGVYPPPQPGPSGVGR